MFDDGSHGTGPPYIPTKPANTTDDGGFCQLIMHHTIRVDDVRFSIFGPPDAGVPEV